MIFGDLHDGNGSIIHNGTSLDHAANYAFGAFFILTFFASKFFNIFVFFYYYKKPFNTTSMLFQMLAVSDFLVNYLHPLQMIYNLLKPEMDLRGRAVTNLEVASTLTYTVALNVSGLITVIMVVVRYVKIKFPFYRTNKRRIILITVTLYTLFKLSFLIYYQIASTSAYWEPFRQKVWLSGGPMNCNYVEFTISLPFYLLCSLSILTSFLTVTHLYLTSEEAGQELSKDYRSSSITILLLNCANVIMVLLKLVRSVPCIRHLGYGLNYLDFVSVSMMPMMICGTNAMIMVFRSAGMKKVLQNRVKKVREVLSSWFMSSSFKRADYISIN